MTQTFENIVTIELTPTESLPLEARAAANQFTAVWTKVAGVGGFSLATAVPLDSTPLGGPISFNCGPDSQLYPTPGTPEGMWGCSADVTECTPSYCDGVVTLRFSTLNAPPLLWAEAIALKYPALQLKIAYMAADTFGVHWMRTKPGMHGSHLTTSTTATEWAAEDEELFAPEREAFARRWGFDQ